MQNMARLVRWFTSIIILPALAPSIVMSKKTRGFPMSRRDSKNKIKSHKSVPDSDCDALLLPPSVFIWAKRRRRSRITPITAACTLKGQGTVQSEQRGAGPTDKPSAGLMT